MRDEVPANWQSVLLVCGKCSKKVGGGFGEKGRTPLVKALRKLLPKGKKRRQAFGVVETKCLGLCPKRAVVAIDGRRPDRWQLIAPGTPIDEVAARLDLTERA